MRVTGQIASTIEQGDLELLEILSPEQGHILKRLGERRSKELFLLVDVTTSSRNESQGLHIIKIRDTQEGNIDHSSVHKKLTRFDIGVPELIASARINSRTALMYKLPSNYHQHVQPLSLLVGSDAPNVISASEHIANIVETLRKINPPDDIAKEHLPSTIYDAMLRCIGLSEFAQSSLATVLDSISINLRQSDSIMFEGVRSRLPNPISFARSSELWNGTQIVYLSGCIHGDLHVDNIICDRNNKSSVIIDWGAYKDDGIFLADWAFLELDILLHYIPPTDKDDWREWTYITEFLSSAISPEGEPTGRLAPMAWRLIKSIREGINLHIEKLSNEHANWLEMSFWLAATSAAIRMLLDVNLDNTQRVAILLYGAFHLDRLLYQLQLPEPSSRPEYIEFETRQSVNAIDWVQVGDPLGKEQLDIFISYAHQDREIAKHITNDLHEKGYSTWLDISAFKISGISEITKYINIAPIFVVLVSSVSSESELVQVELLWAKNKGKKIFYLLIENQVNSLPDAIDFSVNYAQGLRKLLNALPKPQTKTVSLEVVQTVDRRLLEQAYLDRLLFKYKMWEKAYTPLSGTLELSIAPSEMDTEFVILNDPEVVSALGGAETTVDGIPNIISEIYKRRRVVILGDPGAGKSTTLMKMVLDLADEAQKDEKQPLPLLVPLGGYNGKVTLTEYIQTTTDTLLGELGTYLPQLLSEQKIAILLDGLNEMPRSDYEALVEKVEKFIEENSSLLVVVTCRENDYIVDLKLDRISVAPLDPIRVKNFLINHLPNEGEELFWELTDPIVKNQFWPRFSQGGGTEDQFWLAETQPTNVTRPWYEWDWIFFLRIRDNPRSFLALARNPYMLYMITNIYKKIHKLPSNRGQLFRVFVEILMARHKKRILNDDEWIDEKTQREALSNLAYAMQHEGKEGTSITIETAVNHLGNDLMLDIAVSENILEKTNKVRFTHQLLQEFFAAVALDGERLKGKPADEIWETAKWWEPVGWEETSVLMAGYSDDPVSVLMWLHKANPELAARCLVDGGIPQRDDVRQTLIAAWLPRLTGDDRVEARAAIGRALGLIEGDTRPGICLIDNGLPVIEWCEVIDDGPVILREDESKHSAQIETFNISKYLITNAQFRTFIDDGGYTEKWRNCWTNAGWKEKGDRISPEEYSETLRLPNHPRIGLNWYEAVAFSRWLDRRMRDVGRIPDGLEIRLPTELEWEKAARGKDGRIYPWGNEFDKNKCNVVDLQSTTAVGIFPTGASPYGVMDMIGNAWKWCLTKWHENINTENEDNSLEGNAPRVYRGGCWGSNVWRTPDNPWKPDELHCGRRYSNVPEDDRPDAISFFIVLGPTLTK